MPFMTSGIGLAVPFMTSEKRWLSLLPHAEVAGSTGRCSSATGTVGFGSSGDAPGSGGNAEVSRSK